MALTLFVGSTGPAKATCTGPSGGVETCAGAGTQSDISYTAPGVTTLNVNTLTIDPSRISLTGSGASPSAATEVQHYTCSTGNAADCVITPEKPAQNGNPAVAESCAVASGAPSGTSCVAPPVKAAGGPSGNSGPTLVVNYYQPTANTNTPNSGAVIATGTIGVLGASNGSRGGNGSNGYVFSDGGDGANGADGGVITVNVDGAIRTSNNCVLPTACPNAGIVASSVGGDGGDGGDAKGISGDAGDGGLGGSGGNATVNFNSGSVETLGNYSAGIAAISQGGHGGNGGGGGGLVFNPGGGSPAGAGGNANVFTGVGTTITTYGIYSHGIAAQSIGGGGGGSAGGFGLFSSSGGSGGNGGNGGIVQVTNNANITTWGNNSQGILAQTIGGGGGDGGSNFGLFASGGSGSLGGNGGPANVVTVGVTNSGAIVTHGEDSNGILAQSIGGGGGNGGNSGGLVSLGGDGASTTNGGIVEVTNTAAGSISTDGKQSAGIFAQSVGGGGGNGGTSGGLFSAGGKGGAGGNGARVTVINAGDIETGKNGAGSVNSAGIFAQSVGGGGGNGGGAFSGGIGFSVAIGGAGGSGGTSGAVEVLRDANDTAYSIITHGDQSDAVFAQSIGGGGGNGGFSVSGAVGVLALAMGGAAGNASDGNIVTVETAGSLTTYGQGSRGIFAQSIGGTGGNGGAAIAVAVNATGTFAAAIGIGGDGGAGGASKLVTVSSLSDISTAGNNAGGIVAQSVGGGGGNGGYSIGGAIGGAVGIAVNIGGKGAGGGYGADVIVGSSGSIHTKGNNSTGILAQSVGGGGGNGGFTISAALGGGAASVGLGGAGADGSNAGNVTVNADGAGHAVATGYTGTWNLVTEGKNAVGIQAESIGGGGGNGGFSGSLAAGGLVGVGVSLGGTGGGGGDAGTATVNNGKKVGNTVTQNNILTIDDNSTGILAQSIGGGGGNGGFAVTLSVSGSYEGAGGAAAVSVGGSGATGGVGKDVFVTSYGNIATYGKQSDGILAQSIGGGGGNGGFSVAGTFTTGALGASVAVGGSGGSGQSAGEVTVTSTGNIQTHGDQSIGILAQSVGGGGGNGGFAGAGAITLQGVSAAVGLGGSGAGGGSAKTVRVTSTGDITTYGDQAIGILAQSVGGGGGNGGSTVSLALAKDAGIGVALGGKGGAAGNGLDVTVISTGNISTGAGFISGGVRGTGAAGILAQSVGGGGGNGGFAGTLGGGKSIAVGVAFGGSGAGGGSADIVKVTSTGNIATNFDNSSGIIAQSIGGGGGNGGFSVAVTGALGDPDAATASVAIGGKGGVGGVGKDVTVTSSGTITTTGKFSNGILAQSIGGGGGNGGFAVAGSATTGNAGIGVGVGGTGATGSTAGKVIVNSYSLVDSNGQPVLQAPAANTVSIWTQGDNSSGIFAQSVGGGGGSGGFAGSLGVGLGGGGLGVSIGGGAGSGSTADTVTVTSYNNILTGGKDSFGIMAQSVGGGGGNGGFAIALAGSKDMAASVAVGGSGSSGGDAAVVTVTSHGNIETDGDGSHAIFAQSVGGGGGNGGGAIAGTLTGEGTGSLAVGVGGSGDNGGNAKAVTVTSTGDLRTEGLKADGILAQSIGGGGGNGGFTGALAITTGAGAIGVGVGGSGKGGGNADTVTVTSTGNIVTLKNGSNGILAQSVGGGGGNGGAAVTIAGAGQKAAAAVSVGGAGAKGGTSQLVTVNNIGTIDTTGDKANGILAQSIGGGGGTGGFAISGEMVVDGAGGASVSVGGNGGAGQDGGRVVVNSNVGTTLANNNATIHTVGGDSNGIFAQSVGGGGGDGGFSGAVSVTGQNAKAAIAVSVGGSGAGSGDGKIVNVTSVDNILTEGNGANGILAQSVGGGGGNGGFSFAATIKGSLGKNPSKNGAVSVSLGGGAGSGGDAEKVTVDSTGIIQTGGDKAFGVLAQSVGGGGGTGGLSVAAALNLGEGGNQITAAVGGEGGGGGTGGEVLLTRHGSTITTGDQSVGLFAQSVGGSGGNGGMAISGVIAGTDAKTLSASVGGFGGAGTNSDKVTIDNTGAISTYGVESHAIQAQSIGGGGGNGGMAVSAVIGSLGTGTNFNAGVTVGGFGGDAGFAGAVFVTNHGLLQTGLLAAGQTVTNGDGAYGIFAQSVGGGGGSGGNAITGVLGLNGNNAGTQVNVSVAVGGSAGNGNTGGNVTIRQYGGIETNGMGAFGILAQSIGGGGGTGGRANSISLQLGAKCTLPKVCEPAGGKPNWNLQATVGGAGGTGNDAQTVDVGNYDFITTHGDKSSGIVAQSIGGGGGIGGDAYVGTGGLLAIPYVPVDPTLLLKPLGTSSLTRSGTVAIGGNGAGGGNGGTVIVTNEGVITTNGTKSDGIHAQSIGGGGGDGGDGEAGALGTVGIGGQGKAAGNGGSVTVTNGKSDLSQAGMAIIQTFGTSPTPPAEGAPSAEPEQGYSAGIFAQSVGGGGGTGGGAGGLLSLGGSGKAGGTGGHVTVNNYGGILTHADDSVGIFAQSIGGGGGAGGSLGISAIAVGGSGGASGSGGQVDVINDAMIETHGIDSYAIQAQSVGGGGGSGGGKNGGITGSIPALISIGGAGGSSGIGGIVNVTNDNSLHTYGAGADGINAQSIGGGGGSGGRAIGFIAVGGKGGDVGNGTTAGSTGSGGVVTVNNNANGTITVEGVGAHGIFAQSVGAGGGSGGGAFGVSIVPVAIGVGGGGGSSGDGGVVTVNNHGDITTVSASSVAIFAESIGGGGGTGAMSVAASPAPGAFTFGIGGDGGTNGKGGNVNVTNFSDGIIHTKGFGSTGIMAQSVGGGGGAGGASYSVSGGPPGLAIALGGKGAAGGDGGIVTVINNGAMQLDGDNSVAIFAQSVGGGGGSGGTAIAAAIGVPVFIGGDTGATGKGGDVTVTNTGQIRLTGNGSVGIFAQSVGGGGGVVTAGTDGIVQAVAGGSGNGGVVTINSNVAMLITGDNSVGVFGQSIGGGGGVGGFSGNYLGLDQVQAASSMMMAMVAAPQGFMGSAGGGGTGGAITFTQTADLAVTGKNSFALMEQSAGGTGDIADNGDINVTIASGVTITGGSGAGAGISYKDGRDNLLTNNGTVRSISLIDGYAMRGGVGNETFDNKYLTVGSMDLGAGLNIFNNKTNAVYLMGDTVYLDLPGQFNNDGFAAPGGLDRVMTTEVTGNWSQSLGGVYLLDLDLDPEADRINVSGKADVNGLVSINIMNPGAAKPGNQDYVILEAQGGVTDNGLKLDTIPSAVAQYSLKYPNPEDIVLNVDINFARTGLTENQTAVGQAINAIQTDLTSPNFTKIANAIFYIPTLDQLGAVYDTISGEGISGFQQPEFDANNTFLAQMNRQSDAWRMGLSTDPMSQSLKVPEAAYAEPPGKAHPFDALTKAPNPQRWNYWATAGGNSGVASGDPVVGSAALGYKSGNFAVGLDSQGDPDVLMGFALGGVAGSFTVPDRETSGNIIGGHAGAYGARKWGQFYINGSLAMDLYSNTTDRFTSVPGAPNPLNPVPAITREHWTGDFMSAGFGTSLEAGWRQPFGAGAITPFAGLQFQALAMQAFSEKSTSDGALGLDFDSRTVISLPVSLGLQLDTTVAIGETKTLQAWGRAAWLHEFKPDRSVEPTFQAAPGYAFVVQGAAAAEDAVTVNAGVKLNWSGNTSVFATFDGKFADRVQTYGGNVGFRVNW
ncbi:outer membrane autotransporter barrel domain-containing protein [Mesorhizobium sp. 113-1-2]|nr:outer membrane autotransporter barrel domain-containing protein [Mesorhizobium sp. 113-1-2]